MGWIQVGVGVESRWGQGGGQDGIQVRVKVRVRVGVQAKSVQFKMPKLFYERNSFL